jgi:hypothetical protein
MYMYVRYTIPFCAYILNSLLADLHVSCKYMYNVYNLYTLLQ